MSGPFGWPELTVDVAWTRRLVVMLAALWGSALWRGRRTLSFASGLLCVAVATGFWVLTLARPYGLFVDAEATRRAGEIAVAAASGQADESLVAGEPVAYPVFARLAGAGVPARSLLVLPSLLPPLLVTLVGIVVLSFWRRREDAFAGACLWLAFATGDLDAARGLGVVPGAWSHPEAALALPAAAAVALLAGRLAMWPGCVAAFLLALLPAMLAPHGIAPNLGDAVLLLTLDQGLWLVLGLFGLLRRKDPACLGLTCGGAVAVLASSLVSAGNAWAGHAAYRLGLLLAAASFPEWLEAIGEAVRRWRPRFAGDGTPARLGLALTLTLGVPASFLTWWHPSRTDPVARDSGEAVSPALDAAMAYVRDQTPKDAVFLASPDYAGFVAVVGERRLLRAPSVLTAKDDARRQRTEGAILQGHELPPGAERYRVRYVLIAPGDFRSRGIRGPEDLEGRPGLVLRYADAARYRVYEVVR